MIRITTIFTLLFIFCSSHSFGQEETIKLNLEEGKTYVFESKMRRTMFDRNDNPIEKYIGSSKFAFEIEEVNSDKIIFSFLNIKGKSERLEEDSRSIDDSEFQPIVENINQNTHKFKIFNSLLYLVDLKFELDLKHDSVIQIDKNVMCDKMDSILKIKGYDSKFISETIDYFKNDTAVIPRFLNHKNFFLYFNGAIKKNQNEIWSPFLNKNYTSSGNKNEFVHGENKQIPGAVFEKVKLNDKNGFISNYYTVKTDTAKTNRSNKYVGFSESEFSFVSEYETREKDFTFRCTIENPKDSIVTLLLFDKPFGEEFTRIFLTLDNNNSVFFQKRIPEQSLFLFATHEPKSIGMPIPADFIFYSEPGDTVDLKVINIENRQDVKISGNRKAVNQVLYNLQTSKMLFPLNFNSINFLPSFEHKQAEESVEIFNTYLEENNVTIEKHVHSFLKNELIATKFLNYFSLLTWNKFSKDRFTLENKAKQKKLKEQIENFDIHDIYNDYGIYSRHLSNVYLQYYLNNLSRVNSTGTTSLRTIVSEEFNQAKLILGGSVFYRVMASGIVNSIARNRTIFIYPTKYEYNGAIQAIDKLINQSFDSEYIKYLKEFMDKRQNWEKDSYFPSDEFYKQNGDKTRLEEFTKGKPTVLYVSENWGRDRYYLDDLAKKNPEIRFVYLVEGNSFNSWKEYLERAEPVAEQLILINYQKTLSDIFIRSGNNFIVYDKNGKLLDFDIKDTVAIRLAKDCLKDKKQLNKSQLQIIIIVLIVALVILILAFTIWKWRVRQRFRKEEQSRKLRELELTAIRSQMNPHFLFNSLNSVQNLVQQNKGREAHLYLSDFAGLIRKVLRNSEKEEVSLAEELEMTEQYLNLEKLRFDFEFSVLVDKEIDAFNTLVPSMLLQPFAENAVIHGLQNKPEKRELKIEIQKMESGIKINIEDNGIGREAAAEIAKAKNGLGTKMIQERLKILQKKQGEKYSLEIIDLKEENETGTRVEIFIPEEK